MARQLRVHVPSMPVHVVSRGNNKMCIFTEAGDYEKYLNLLAAALKRFGATCHAYCLIWNHVHLDLRPGAIPLSRTMHQVNSAYCGWFNRRHGRVGHVLQGRPFERIIEDGSYQMNVQRYFALNPVVAGKVARAEDWPWSSYRAAAGFDSVPDFLDLEGVASAFDAGSWSEARERYITFVNAPSAIEAVWGPLFAGSQATADRLEPLIAAHRENSEFVYAERYATRPRLETLFIGKSVGRELDEAVRHAFVDHAYTLKEIAILFRVHPTTIWRWAQRAAWLASEEDDGVVS